MLTVWLCLVRILTTKFNIMTELEKLVQTWEKFKPIGTPYEHIWNGFIDDAKAAIEREKQALSISDVVRSVFTVHSTEDEGIIKIVGTEDEAKKEVEEFKKQHNYADFFYEKQNVS